MRRNSGNRRPGQDMGSDKDWEPQFLALRTATRSGAFPSARDLAQALQDLPRRNWSRLWEEAHSARIGDSVEEKSENGKSCAALAILRLRSEFSAFVTFIAGCCQRWPDLRSCFPETEVEYGDSVRAYRCFPGSDLWYTRGIIFECVSTTDGRRALRHEYSALSEIQGAPSCRARCGLVTLVDLKVGLRCLARSQPMTGLPPNIEIVPDMRAVLEIAQLCNVAPAIDYDENVFVPSTRVIEYEASKSDDDGGGGSCCQVMLASGFIPDLTRRLRTDSVRVAWLAADESIPLSMISHLAELNFHELCVQLDRSCDANGSWTSLPVLGTSLGHVFFESDINSAKNSRASRLVGTEIHGEAFVLLGTGKPRKMGLSAFKLVDENSQCKMQPAIRASLDMPIPLPSSMIRPQVMSRHHVAALQVVAETCDEAIRGQISNFLQCLCSQRDLVVFNTSHLCSLMRQHGLNIALLPRLLRFRGLDVSPNGASGSPDATIRARSRLHRLRRLARAEIIGRMVKHAWQAQIAVAAFSSSNLLHNLLDGVLGDIRTNGRAAEFWGLFSRVWLLTSTFSSCSDLVLTTDEAAQPYHMAQGLLHMEVLPSVLRNLNVTLAPAAHLRIQILRGSFTCDQKLEAHAGGFESNDLEMREHCTHKAGRRDMDELKTTLAALTSSPVVLGRESEAASQASPRSEYNLWASMIFSQPNREGSCITLQLMELRAHILSACEAGAEGDFENVSVAADSTLERLRNLCGRERLETLPADLIVGAVVIRAAADEHRSIGNFDRAETLYLHGLRILASLVSGPMLPLGQTSIPGGCCGLAYRVTLRLLALLKMQLRRSKSTQGGKQPSSRTDAWDAAGLSWGGAGGARARGILMRQVARALKLSLDSPGDPGLASCLSNFISLEVHLQSQQLSTKFLFQRDSGGLLQFEPQALEMQPDEELHLLSRMVPVVGGGAVMMWGNIMGLSMEQEELNRATKETAPAAPQITFAPMLSVMAKCNVRQISCGHRHSAFVTLAGMLYTFGSGDAGRLGHGHEKSLRAPQIVSALAGRAYISGASCGADHTVCFDDKGAAYSFGWGEVGRLGLGDVSKVLEPQQIVHGLYDAARPPKNSRTQQNAFAVDPASFPLQITNVAAGREHTIFLTGSGIILSCGGGRAGQLGLPGAPSCVPYPCALTGVISDVHIRCISAGDAHSAAVDSAGFVYVWGFGASGALGLGDAASAYTPQKLVGLEKARAVSCGAFHTSAVAKSGALWLWGDNLNGQLGVGSEAKNIMSPARAQFEDAGETSLPSLPHIVQVDSGKHMTVAMDTEGHMHVTGSPVEDTCAQRFVCVSSQMQRAKFVAVGSHHGAYVTADLSSYKFRPQKAVSNCCMPVPFGTSARSLRLCWDSINSENGDRSPQEGVAESAPTASQRSRLLHWGLMSAPDKDPAACNIRWTPRECLLPSDAILDVCCGDFHILALTASGEIYGWGYNSNGQVDAEPASDSVLTSPNLVPAGAFWGGASPISFVQGRVTAISAWKSGSACATADGRLYTWGDKSFASAQIDEWMSAAPLSITVASGCAEIPSDWPVVSSVQNAPSPLSFVATPGRRGLVVHRAPQESSNLRSAGTPCTSYLSIASPASESRRISQVSCGHSMSAWLSHDGHAYLQHTPGRASAAVAARDRSTVVALDLPEGVYAKCAAVGLSHSVVVATCGNAYCFGCNSDGQCGSLDNCTAGRCTTSRGVITPQELDGYESEEVIEYAACGWHHTMLLTSAGRVFTLGQNTFGQLGLGPDIRGTCQPRELHSLRGCRKIVAGAKHSCALLNL